MKGSSGLLQNHIFKFDFLNDSFDKLPAKLKSIIKDKEKQKRLIICINPPYAEATTASTTRGTGKNKALVARTSKNTYEEKIGKASNEIFAQFMVRIYDKLPLGNLAIFSKLKYINSSNFKKFRNFFKASFKKEFIVRTDTFDNVKGRFPIGFLIWNMAENEIIKNIFLDVIENDGNKSSVKNFYANLKRDSINKWIPSFNKGKKGNIGFMNCGTPDFQNTNYVYIQIKEQTHNSHHLPINSENLIPASIHFAVRHCIKPLWLNDRDQFLFPNDDFEEDTEFQNDCLILTMFNDRIKSTDGVNHWILFFPSEVKAKSYFESNFMSSFIRKRELSKEAVDSFEAGKAIFKYYHEFISGDDNTNASLYEIREKFRGLSKTGKLASKSSDLKFQNLDDGLKKSLQFLSRKIAEKAYKYEFLQE